METTRARLLYIMVGLALGHVLMGASPLAAQGDCKAILDVSTKVFKTPTHVYVTGTVGSLTVTSEMIYAAGNIYMKIEGKWHNTGTTNDMEQLSVKNRQNGKASTATCRYLKDELVNGEPAAVYIMSDESPKFHSQMWISKAKGLPLRQEDDIGAGSSKTHNSTRYEYGDIKPPI
jgi:hypothetical protein